MRIESDDEKTLLLMYRKLRKSGLDECALEEQVPSQIHWVTITIRPMPEYSENE